MPEQENNVVVEETVQETQEQSTETVEDTATETTETKDTEEQAKPSLLDEFEYQYNKESQKPQSIEELKELAEMGRYYKEQGKEEVSFIKSQAKKYNMTTSEYRKAVDAQEKTEAIQTLADKENVSVDIAEKLYKATVIEEKENNKAKAQATRDKYFDEWVTHPDYKSIDKISDEVMTEFEKGGKSLVEIYTAYDQGNKIASLTEKLSKYESQEQVQDKNNENSEASTGSVTGNGSTDNLYTKDQVKNMSREDVMKNYNKVQESTKQWK